MVKRTNSFTDRLKNLLPIGQKEEDPLSSLRALTIWLEDLPVGDAGKAHNAILDQVSRLNERLAEPTKSHLEVLMLLDEKDQDLRETLIRQYLRNARMSRSMESQLWHAIYNQLWETARAYHTYILQLNNTAASTWLKPLLPIITLRLIRNFRLLMKLRSIRYLQLGDKLWLRLHNLYKLAESTGFHLAPLLAYPTDKNSVTCEAEYLHCLMLQQAHAGTLYPRQLDLVDQWLSKWAPIFLTLSAKLDATHHTFNIDLGADHGPRRVRKAEYDDSHRFWATGNLVAHVMEIHDAIKDGKSPADMGLSSDVRPSEALELLDHLRRQWSSLLDREQRRYPRQPIKKLVGVVHGLPEIIKCIPQEVTVEGGVYTSDMVYNEIDDVHIYGFVRERTKTQSPATNRSATALANMESWVMHDESQCGYGAIVETYNKDWLRVGTLVATHHEGDEKWSMGVLRRLSRINEKESSVGIETLQEVPEVIMLYGKGRKTEGYSVDGVDTMSNGDLPVAAIHLAPCDGNRICLIMDPADYQYRSLLEIRHKNEKRLVQLGQPLERGEGWIKLTADLLGSKQAG